MGSIIGIIVIIAGVGLFAAAIIKTMKRLHVDPGHDHLQDYIVYVKEGEDITECVESDSMVIDFDGDLRKLSDEIRLYPDNAELYLNRAEILSDDMAYTIAIKDYTRALELADESCQVLYDRAYAFMNCEKPDLDKALEDINRGLDLQEEPSCEPYCFKAEILFEMEGDAVSEIPGPVHECLDMAIEIDPDESSCYFSRSWMYISIKNYKKALDDYNIIEKLGHDNFYMPSLSYDKAALHRLLKEYDRAIEFFQNAIEYGNAVSDAYFPAEISLAALYRELGRFRHAEKIYADVAADTKNLYVSPLVGLIICRLELQNISGALESCRDLLNLFRNEEFDYAQAKKFERFHWNKVREQTGDDFDDLFERFPDAESVECFIEELERKQE
ncbi:MAG: tetratricopeptide repeat protein [bacterium]|nr:tetratricopeptide repeat protein [bacterium]